MAQDLEEGALDNLITEVCEKLNNLKTRERDVNANTRSDIDLVEKDVLLRRIRAQKRDLSQQLTELSVQRALLQNDVEEEDENGDEEENDDEPANPGVNNDQELDDNKHEEYNRLVNMMSRTKADVMNRKLIVEALLKDGNDLLTDSEKRLNDIKIKSQPRTIAEQVSSYKLYNKDVIKICSHDEVERFHSELSEVLHNSNEIFCVFEAAKDREKINESTNYSTIKNLSIDKYEPSGKDKFIKYSTFMDEFREYVITRPLKPVVKLNYLKTCLGGEALELVRCYTHGDQLNQALAALENAFNKPDFIISEIYRNLKLLPPITTFKAIKTAKEQVQTLNVSLATLRTLGYEKI